MSTPKGFLNDNSELSTYSYIQLRSLRSDQSEPDMIPPVLNASLRERERDPEGDRTYGRFRSLLLHASRMLNGNGSTSVACAGGKGVAVATVDDIDAVFSRSVAFASARFRAGGDVLTKVVLDAAEVNVYLTARGSHICLPDMCRGSSKNPTLTPA
ncbi:hypothetical protein EI94DRAFT_1807607 [Lactarius quietus]|nr:hypothetical protein EI94DRAFT_1807607 [Lactarius quietus]